MAMANSYAGMSSKREYQVYLSFRGVDTRDGFTDFLAHSLTDAGVNVFQDDQESIVGKRIDEWLKQAIDNSRIYITIFSPTYASSQWSLRELTQILANTSKSEGVKEILPIFFEVEPNDVKLKTPLYHHAIHYLKKDSGNEEVDEWRTALMKVGAMRGWEVKRFEGQGKLIKLVVEQVVRKLRIKHRVVTKYLVGVDDQVVAIRHLLDVGAPDGRLIKIHGMGGIGKTTLAEVVFNQISDLYGKCCCFLEDVRVKSSRPNGLVELQKKLLSEIGVHAGTWSIDEIHYGMKRIREVLNNNKVFIVLDDVDNGEQVEKLVGKSTLCSGSRILITTRNKDVLQNFRPKYEILEYEMEVMGIDHALQLFSKHAFDRDSPSKDCSFISKEVVFATGRLPLALQAVGSLLSKKEHEHALWEEVLDQLKKVPHKDVFGKLKSSYDALSFEQQQIFLDIACFFIGEDKTNAIYMWENCGLLRNGGVDVLNSMCLIKITENNTFWMHDQLRDLGREIVRRQSLWNPGERSRLWICEEILQAKRTNEMKNNVQALDLDVPKSHCDVIIESTEIERFGHLTYLKLTGGTFVGDLANCLTNVRWLFWSHPPQMCEPTNMQLKNVVVLQFSNNYFINDSNLQSLIEIAGKLKVLSLESCYNINRTPNFHGCLNLERLTLKNCSNLREIDGSIGKLKCLIDLRIDTCVRLKGLPEQIEDLVNLKHFFVQRSNVKKLPYSMRKLKLLKICLEFEHVKGI